MRTTTVRFDEETWADIQRESQRLGIAHAEFIRGAVHRRLGRLAEADRITELEQRIDAVADRLTSVARLRLVAVDRHSDSPTRVTEARCAARS